ncbi:MAG: hypothetical protein KIT24_12440 [Phycisphaeraceae bacterium]|nr:hypothetical protein [Phycisphaeraceae bacterium]
MHFRQPIAMPSTSVTLGPVRIGIIANPRAGRGKARSVVGRIERALNDAGHTHFLHQAGPIAVAESDLADCQALLLAGGDGTVHHALPLACRTGIPIWHVPLGTENLFSRAFGMGLSPENLLRALNAFRVQKCDLGSAGDTPFALMCSVGPDAQIVHDVNAHRRGRISRMTYVPWCIRQMLRPRLPPLTIEADGSICVREAPGIAVVANCHRYGFGINPAPEAMMDDGLLDLVFLPASSSLGVFAWAMRGKFGRLRSSARRLHLRVREVTIRSTSDAPFCIQADGEPLPARADGSLHITTLPGALHVLLPTEFQSRSSSNAPLYPPSGRDGSPPSSSRI